MANNKTLNPSARLGLQVPLNLQGQQIFNVAAPTDPDDVATMQYVDSRAQGVINTVTISTSGDQSFDTNTGVLTIRQEVPNEFVPTPTTVDLAYDTNTDNLTVTVDGVADTVSIPELIKQVIVRDNGDQGFDAATGILTIRDNLMVDLQASIDSNNNLSVIVDGVTRTVALPIAVREVVVDQTTNTQTYDATTGRLTIAAAVGSANPNPNPVMPTDTREDLEIIRSAIENGNTDRIIRRRIDGSFLGWHFDLANGNRVSMQLDRDDTSAQRVTETYSGTWIGTITGNAGDRLQHRFIYDAPTGGMFMNDEWEIIGALITLALAFTEDGFIAETADTASEFHLTADGLIAEESAAVQMTADGLIVEELS